MLRGPHRVDADGIVRAKRAPHIAGPDEHFDSARLPHAARWSTPLPSRMQAHLMLDEQLRACIAAIPDGDDDAALYFPAGAVPRGHAREAFAWLRGAGCAAPGCDAAAPRGPRSRAGRRRRGAWQPSVRRTAFDNERAGHEVAPIRSRSMPPRSPRAISCVCRGRRLRRRRLWRPRGHWRAAHALSHPARWRRGATAGKHAGSTRQLGPTGRSSTSAPGRPRARAAGPDAGAARRGMGARRHDGRHRLGVRAWNGPPTPSGPIPGWKPVRAGTTRPWFGDHRELRGGARHTPRPRPSFRTLPARANDVCGIPLRR